MKRVSMAFLALDGLAGSEWPCERGLDRNKCQLALVNRRTQATYSGALGVERN